MDTFFWYGKLATLGDLDGLLGLVSWALGHILDRLNDLVALEDFAVDDVLAVEVTEFVSLCQFTRKLVFTLGWRW